MSKTYSIILSVISGCVNVTTVYAFAMKVSHITGTLSQLVVEGQRGNWTEVMLFIGLLGAFFFGGVVSGAIFFDKPTTVTQRHVGVLGVLGISAVVLALVPVDRTFILYLLSCMMGIQNGVYLVYNGSVLRTTHFTGYITDVGFVMGQWVKGVPVDKDKAYLFCLSILFYILGGMIAAMSMMLTFNPLWFVSLGYIFTAVYLYKQTV